MIIIRCFPDSDNSLARLANNSLWKTIKIAGDQSYYRAEGLLHDLWQPQSKEGPRSSFSSLSDELKFKDISGAQEFIDSVQDQDWYRRTFPFEPTERLQRLGITDHPRITVEPWSKIQPFEKESKDHIARAISEERRTENSEFTPPKIQLREPLERSNNQLVLLHELAHIAHLHRVDQTDRDRFERGHGPGFRGSFIYILHHALGPESAEALRDGYDIENLRYYSDAVHRDAIIPGLLHPHE